MTSPCQTFSPTILNDHEQLQSFFSGKRELEYLANLSPQDYVHPKKGELYYSRWSIAWIIVSSPFRIVTAMALATLAYLAKILTCGMTTLDRRLWIASDSVMQNLCTALNQITYGDRLIMPMRNRHAFADSDVYCAKSLQSKNILDPKVKELFKIDQKIDFYRPGGICRGSTLWFNTLFYRGLDLVGTKYQTIGDYCAALASLYEQGSTKQGAVLQGIPLEDEKILALHQKKIGSIPKSEIRRDNQATVKYLADLPDGTYGFGVQTHMFSYIKFAGEQYILDMNNGLIRVDTTEELIDEIIKYIKISKSEREIAIFYHLPEDMWQNATQKRKGA